MAVPHTETDFVPFVFDALQFNDGKASFAQLRAFIKKNMKLNTADKEILPSLGCPRWHQILRNLKSNKTIVKNFNPDIREIPGGFAIRASSVYA